MYIYTDGTTEPNGHTASDWIVDQDPAPGAEGRKHTECTVCGVTMETSIIEALPVETESDTEKGTEPTTDSETTNETDVESETQETTDSSNDSESDEGTRETPSKGGCSGEVNSTIWLLLLACAFIPVVVKRSKEY